MGTINTIFGTYKKEETNIEKKASISPFDIAKVICTKKNIEKIEPYIDTYKYSQYMLNQIFCQNIELGYKTGNYFECWKIIKEINIMKISNRAHFNLLLNIIPENGGYMKYRFKQNESKEEKINALKWYFKYEKDETIYRYVEIIHEDEMNEILEHYENYKKYGVKK